MSSRHILIRISASLISIWLAAPCVVSPADGGCSGPDGRRAPAGVGPPPGRSAVTAPQPRNGGSEAPSGKEPGAGSAATGGAPPVPSEGRAREPRKETKAPHRKRLFRTTRGAVVLIIIGAVVLGAAARASLDEERGRSSP